MMQTYSLRNALLLSLLTTSSIIWGITVYLSYQKAHHEVTQLFQAELSQSAHVLLAVIDNSHENNDIPSNWQLPQQLEDFSSYKPEHPYEGHLVFQLWDHSGNLLLHSASAPTHPISEQEQGFSTTTLNNHLWHVYSTQDKHGHLTLHVGQKDEVYQRLANEITGHLMKHFMFGPPVAAFVIWLLVGRAMVPFNRLADDVKKREANLLTPLTPRRLPSEVAPLVDSLNNLLARLHQAFEDERSFAGDASHELRTPLAGLKIQSEVAIRAKDEESRLQALKNIIRSVDRMTHMVQQLLTLARVDPDAGLNTIEDVDLRGVCITVISELEYKAKRKNTELRLDVHGDKTSIQGNQALLDTLIHNLLDNAIRYTPDNSHINISITPLKNVVNLQIDDDGPGIPQAERSKVLQRFYRGSNHGNRDGSGLGFSIVTRIASLHSAGFSLDGSILGGLQVKLSFPHNP